MQSNMTIGLGRAFFFFKKKAFFKKIILPKKQ